MNSDTDVLEFDFPDYEEPYPPFPDVKVTLFDKEDSYSRNRDIADKIYADENQVAEKKQSERKTRREIKKRKTIAVSAGLILSVVLATAAIDFINSWEQPAAMPVSNLDIEELPERKTYSGPFFEAAEIDVHLEKIGPYYDEYIVTVNFTVKNTSDEEIGFVPHRFYMKLKSGGVIPPHIPDTENFSYSGLESPWNGMHIPPGEQVSFSVKYSIPEEKASEIKCFAYNVYSNYLDQIYLYEDIADTDGYISSLVEKEIERIESVK